MAKRLLQLLGLLMTLSLAVASPISAAQPVPAPTPVSTSLPNLPTPVPTPTTGLQDGESPRDGVVSSNFIETMMPPMNTGGVERKYASKPIWNYTLDTDSSWYDPVTPAIMMVINGEVVLDAMLVRFGIMILEQAYTLDIFNYIGDYVADIITSVKTATWNGVFDLMMVLIGVYILFNAIIYSRHSKSIDAFIKTVIVIVIAMLFFAYPKQILSTAIDTSTEVSGAILTGGQTGTAVNQTVAKIGNQIWEQQVLNPWYYMQFGSVEIGQNEGEKFLSYPKGNKLREKNMEAQIKNGNTFMTEDGIFLRLIVIASSHVVNTVILFCLVAMATLIVASQFIPLALICLSPMIFALALFPHFGLRIITKWMQAVLGAIFFKVVLSTFLSLYLQTSAALSKALGQYYLLVVYLELLIVIALFFERKRIAGMLTNLGRGEQAVAEAANQKSNWGEQIGGAIKKTAQVGLAVGAAVATGGSSAMMTGAVMGGKAGMLMQGVGMAQKFADSKKNRVLNPMADTMLRDKYFNEKQQTEVQAHATGMPVQYSPFVQQVNERQSKGLPLFSEMQKKQALDELKDIEKQGGDVQRYFNKPNAVSTDPDSYVEENSSYQSRMAQKHRDFEMRRQNRLHLLNDVEQSSPAPASPVTPPPLESFSSSLSSKGQEEGRRQDSGPRGQHGSADFPMERIPVQNAAQRPSASRPGSMEGGSASVRDNGISGDLSASKTGGIYIPRPMSSVYESPTYGDANYQREMELLGQLERAERYNDNEAVDRYMAELQQLDPAAYGKFTNGSDIKQAIKADVQNQPRKEAAAASETPSRGIPLSDSAWKAMGGNGGAGGSRRSNMVMMDDPAQTAHLLSMQPPPDMDSEGQSQSVQEAVQMDMEKHNLSPVQYTDRLRQEQSGAYRKLADLEMYQSAKGGSESKQVMPELHARVERQMAESGYGIEESIAAAKGKIQSINERMDVMHTAYEIKPKLFVEIEDGPSQAPTRVRTPDEYRVEVRSKPIEQLSFVVKDVDVEYKQSILNDFEARQQMESVTKEEYVERLRTEHLDSLKAHRILKQGAQMDPEYKQDSKRQQAIFVDATKRYETAKSLLQVDDGRSHIQYRRRKE